MTNPQRNIAIVLIVLLTASLTGAQPTTDAIVSAIDRNTMAQIRTCEATYLSLSQSRYNIRDWVGARRCWQ